MIRPELKPEYQRDSLLRHQQAIFDVWRFDRVYATLSTKDQKVRHIREHVGKAGLKLVELKRNSGQLTPDSVKSQLASEVVPDLAIYRTQIANTLRIDLAKRLAGLEISPVDLAGAVELVAHAGGVLDYRHEPLEHGAPSSLTSREAIATQALPELHLAAHGLALQYELGSVWDLHAARLRHLVNQPGLAG